MTLPFFDEAAFRELIENLPALDLPVVDLNLELPEVVLDFPAADLSTLEMQTIDLSELKELEL